MTRARSASAILSPLERDEAVTMIDWVRKSTGLYPSLEWLMRVPNGAAMRGGYKANRGVIAQAIKEGLKPGPPDYLLHIAHGGFHGMALELKRTCQKSKTGRGKGGVKTGQSAWLNRMRIDGWCVRVCYGADEAITALRQYVSQPLTKFV